MYRDYNMRTARVRRARIAVAAIAMTRAIARPRRRGASGAAEDGTRQRGAGAAAYSYVRAQL